MVGRRTLLRATGACTLALAGCSAPRRSGAALLGDGARGRGGGRTAHRVRAGTPGHHGARRAIAMDRGAREAAHRLCRRRHARLGAAGQHVDRRVRRARCAGAAAALARCRPQHRRCRLLRRHLADQSSRWHAWSGCRGTSTHGCSSTAATSSHAPACPRCPTPGPASRVPSRRCSAPARRIRCCCRSTNSSRCSLLRCSRTTAAARWRPLRQLSQRGLSPRAGFLHGAFRDRPGADDHRRRHRQPVAGVRPWHLCRLHLRPVEHRRARPPLARDVAQQLGHGRAAWSERPRRVDRRWLEPGDVPALAAPCRGDAPAVVPESARRAAALLSDDRRHAAAAQRLVAPAAGRRPARPCFC